MTEQPFCRRTERVDEAVLVDHDHGVGNAIENRRQMSGACLGIRGVRGGGAARLPQHLAAPGYADADQDEDKSEDQIGGE